MKLLQEIFKLKKEEINVKEVFDDMIELLNLNADIKGIKINLKLNLD